MNKVHLDWSEFKGYLNSNVVTFFQLTRNNTYYLYTYLGPIVITCTIPKDSGSDQTDYEGNYQSKANKPIDLTAFTHKSFSVTNQQTNATLWTPASGKRILLSGYQISIHNNTLGQAAVQVFEGSNSAGNVIYSNVNASGTNYDFATSLDPFVPLAVDSVLKATTTAAIRVSGVLFGYEI